MSDSMRGRVAVAGVGETAYYKRGEAPDPEFKLALEAIITACEDAGIDPRDVDGFASYSNDRSDPSHLAAALGCGARRQLICRMRVSASSSSLATFIMRTCVS